MKPSRITLAALLAAASLLCGRPALAGLRITTTTFAPAINSGGRHSQAAGVSGACTLVIHVDGFRSQKGDAGISLFTSSNGWPEDNTKAFYHSPNPFSGTSATITLHVPPGRYAIAALADTNGDHKMDRNFFGIPKKGFGFSTNPRVFISPPSFDKAAIPVACPITETTIHLIYK